MRTALALMMALTVTTAEGAPKASAKAELACDHAVLVQAWEMLVLARYGSVDQERSAFIVLDPEQQLRFMDWPFDREFRRATFSGHVPAHAVAIIHTHPNSVPLPSAEDQVLAQRTELPVYVVTRQRLSFTTGVGSVTVWSGDWDPGRSRGTHSICRAADPETLISSR